MRAMLPYFSLDKLKVEGVEDTSRIAEFDSLSACRDNSPRMGYEGVRSALVASKGDQVRPISISAPPSSPRRT